MADYDLIIRNGQIYDGSGGDTFQGEVAIKDGLIAAVGEKIDGSAAQEIDAGGKAVTPGFVDVHTHYDGQGLVGFSFDAVVQSRHHNRGHGKLRRRFCALPTGRP